MANIHPRHIVFLLLGLFTLSLSACSPSKAVDRKIVEIASETATATSIVPPTRTVTETPAPTATPEPTSTATPEPTQTLNPTVAAFAEKYGQSFSEYVRYDAVEKVYIAHLVFTGDWSEEHQPIKASDGKLIATSLISMKMQYIANRTVQSVWVPLIVDLGGGNCIQRGSNNYPCSMFSEKTMLYVYQNKGRAFNGWHVGDHIEIWLPGKEPPKTEQASGALAASYVAANQAAYEQFITAGDAAIRIVVPTRILMPCAKEANFDLCFPPVGPE